MPINVIGLLNISIDSEEIIINKHLRLLSREYFENRNISLPAEIRFYKTFIESSAEIKPDFNIDKIPENKRNQIPVFFLWVINLVVNDFEIIHSDWFMGEEYELLKETIKVSVKNVSRVGEIPELWVNAFKIENNLKSLPNEKINEIIDLYNQILELYKEQIKTPDNVNLHWLYAFVKFQECCKSPFSRQCIVHVTSALEFLLVNTPDEASYRAACYTAFICENGYAERLKVFNFLKWAFGTRERISVSLSRSSKNLIDKSDLPENMRKLTAILAKVLTGTIGLRNKDIQNRIEEATFKGPGFKR